ncbi:MAG TPA: hypothetical protein VE913_14425, partial [Longimicrobium sp.]|nr:hypothetical protein [Longimicrobium sp.]
MAKLRAPLVLASLAYLAGLLAGLRLAWVLPWTGWVAIPVALPPGREEHRRERHRNRYPPGPREHPREPQPGEKAGQVRERCEDERSAQLCHDRPAR